MKKILFWGSIFSVTLSSYQTLSYAINGHAGDKVAVTLAIPELLNIFLLGFGMLGVGVMLRKKILKSKDK